MGDKVCNLVAGIGDFCIIPLPRFDTRTLLAKQSDVRDVRVVSEYPIALLTGYLTN